MMAVKRLQNNNFSLSVKNDLLKHSSSKFLESRIRNCSATSKAFERAIQDVPFAVQYISVSCNVEEKIGTVPTWEVLDASSFEMTLLRAEAGVLRVRLSSFAHYVKIQNFGTVPLCPLSRELAGG